MFQSPTRVIHGRGCRHRLSTILEERSWKKPLFVIDPGILKTVFVQDVLDQFQSVEIFTKFDANPRIDDADLCATNAKNIKADIIIALGGGSALDLAKAAAMLAANKGCAKEYIGADKYKNAPLPFIAIPTTCGTGSEVTRASVLSDPAERNKVTVKGNSMCPDYALVDADALESLPAKLIAWTGMDALTHAIEALIAKPANTTSDALSIDAAKSILISLEAALDGNKTAQEAMMQASTKAGLAFTISDVGAVHCLSETIGGVADSPHGLTNAILLTPVLRYYGSCVEEKLALLGQSLSPSLSATQTIDAVESLAKRLNIPGFETLNIKPEDYELIAKMAEKNGSNPSNPRAMTKQDYLFILHTLSGV